MTPDFHLILALVLAAAAPIGLLITRRELRRVRSLVVEELIATVFKNDRGLPQVELVLSRYRTNAKSSVDAMPEQGRQSLVSPHLGGLFFGTICLLGFLILFTPFDKLMQATSILHPDLSVAAFWSFPSGANALADRAAAMRTVSVAGFGFLGGYIFQLSFLTRSALNQELSALSFVRASFRLLIGIILAVITYRALDGIADWLPPLRAAARPAAQGAAQVVTGFGAALGVAFITGFFPEGAIAALSRRLKVRLKQVSQTALEHCEVIPVEVIDGIDSEIGFRLQESNIYDVQNLATANPIALYAETPFGLFECFDWILQAQLCMVVGARTFLALKKHKIRTIFDLERAVLAKGAPDDYVSALGNVLLEEADAGFRATLGCGTDGAPVAVRPAVLRHIVAIMGDDLHVHRLRALWKALMDSTRGEHDLWLFETDWLPGENDRPAR